MQTIERAFSVLRALAHTGGAGVSELARLTDLPKSTVHRILTSLEELALVKADTASTYRIGPGLTSLTRGTPLALADLCRPYLRDLATEFGEAAGLAVAADRSASYLDQVTPDGSVRTRDWTGMQLPLHTVAAGLAIMAHWSREAVSDYAEPGLAVHTPATAATLAALWDKLEAARDVGYAWTFADFDAEINGVGAAIVDSSGAAVASVSVYGPAYRYPGSTAPAMIGTRVAEVAAAISARLQR